ncbi:Cystatin domain-containing protein [Cephalotus follicularis]|uniref:Cystatin domain-containing protein n=1 Tax=Cephalotus follicularis TaxID=3775 RepID=A0A1Q3DEZ0_CEPFO|nr:Cystatin domain-containing protein [Cephalotus follicularis]
MDKEATVGVRRQENRSPSPSSPSSCKKGRHYEYEKVIVHRNSKSDSSDDDEYMELYHKQVKESDGFDVDLFPDSRAIGGIITPMGPLLEDTVEECAATALDKYNKDNETNLVLVKVLKANDLVVSGIVYYITFEVKDANGGADAETRVFQAKVWRTIAKGDEVSICRLKKQ